MTPVTLSRSLLAPRLAQAAEDLCRTAEDAGWHGPDAYDGLWIDWPRVLVAGRRRRQAIIQLHAKSPVDVRRLYRRSHSLIPKTLAVFASARLRLHDVDGAGRHIEAATRALDELVAERSSGSPGWGYPWPVQTRWSYSPAHNPNIVVTAFSALALHDAGERLGVERYSDRAFEAAEWVRRELFVPAGGYYRYHPESDAVIHNGNLLAARVVSRILGQRDESVHDAVARAVERTLRAQTADGAWPYGEGANLTFVDSFHTAYVLESLASLPGADSRRTNALQRGARYWIDHFFGPAGEARLWPDRRYPEDAHAAGSALTALSHLSRLRLVDPSVAPRVAHRAVSAMIRDGHAVYRRSRWGAWRVHYPRWADSHLALGLANAACALADPNHREDRVAV